MPKTYTQICTEAEKKWKFSEKRSGYTRTFLSNLRHYGFLGFFDSKKRIVNKQAQEVLALLQTLTDETAKKHIILAFLNQNKSKLNNHSFGCYLIDILRQEYPNDGWEKYEPKPVIHFQGELFHGTYIQPKTIFSQGLISNNHSSNIEDYIVTTSGSIGISTSKNMDVAKKYALPEPLRSGGDPLMLQPKPIEPQGYIYVFDYKGCEAFDIDQTNIARNKIQFKKIDEVNIKGHIPSYCIRGAWKIKRNEPHAKTWIENSNYNLTKANTLTPPKNSSFIQSTLFYSKETLGLLPTIEKTLVQSTSLTNKK